MSTWQMVQMDKYQDFMKNWMSEWLTQNIKKKKLFPDTNVYPKQILIYVL